MSYKITARAWEVKGLSFAEKLVLVRLADQANDEGVCWPSFVSIARDVEIDVRSVRRIAARLEALGYLTRTKRFKADGLQTSNWLTVLPSADRVAADDPASMTTRTGESSLPGPGSPPGPDRGVLPARTGESSKSSLNHHLIKEADLSDFQRAELQAGRSILIGGAMLLPGSPDADRLCRLMRARA